MGSEVIKLAMKECEKAGFREGYLSAIYHISEILKNHLDENDEIEDYGIAEFFNQATADMKEDPDSFMAKYTMKKEGIA